MGYFKACHKFFNRTFRPADIAYVARQLSVNPSEVCVEHYSKETFARHQRLILSHFVNMPNLYRGENEVLHTSSDGQKFGVAVDSLNANYSFKYLDKDKGVSVVTFIDRRELMWYFTVIKPHPFWELEFFKVNPYPLLE